MLLLLSSLQMLNAQPAESRTGDLAEGSDKVDAGDSIAIVPLTIPLLTGPATISTMVIYAREDAPLVGDGGPGRLRRRHRAGDLARVRPRRPDRAGRSAAPASTS